MATDPHPEDDDDISTAPFTSQPAFGKGLWRHPINFIPASSSTSAPTPPSSTPLSIADAYLAIVCPSSAANPEPDHPTCPTCAHPIKEADSRAHYLSLVHQLSLPRTPTPSAIDRSRMGLKYMEKHGFDVDARKGLGTTGEGRLYPIVPKEKRDLHGIGVQVQGPEEGGEKGRGVAKARVVERLDAGKIQKRARAEKKRDERLRRMFYEDEKVGKYLGDLEGGKDGLEMEVFKRRKLR